MLGTRNRIRVPFFWKIRRLRKNVKETQNALLHPFKTG